VYRGKLKIELSEVADYVGTGQALLRLKDKLKVRTTFDLEKNSRKEKLPQSLCID
jgi:hypothetical protein